MTVALARLIVAGDDQRAAVLRAGGLAVGRQLRRVDVVERLDDLRVGRCACSSSAVVVDSLSSSGMWPSRCG